MPSGSRVEFRQINTNVYEAVDSSYMLLTHDPINSVFILYTTDGTQFRFEDVTGLGDHKCKQIKDRQGNYITIDYGSLAEIETITDTLGREITFNYDGFNHLNSITQNWSGQTHTWATFAYGTQTIQTNFPGLTLNGTTNGTQESVLTRIGLADGSVYSFDYNTYAQVKTIRRYAPNNSNPVNFPGDYFQRSYTTYGLPDTGANPQMDCPRATSRTDWAHDWNSGVTVAYATDPGRAWGQATFPDGTIYKEFFATTGWRRGLTTQTENWSGGERKKWTTLEWTQDNIGISYQLNPRVTETNVYDNANNRRRMTVNYTSFGLPSDVYEYDSDATTVLRRTHTNYNLSAAYTSRRIIGLPNERSLYDGNNMRFSKVTYEYDHNPNPYLQHQGPVIQHDTANYGPTFVQGRGNLNAVRRWDVTDPGESSKCSIPTMGYNTSGSVIFTRDAVGHQTDISYTDSFSDGQNRNTYAYPTRTTDPDDFESTVQYNYNFGAATRAQNPKGAAVARIYDAVGRIERVRNEVNQAYTRYVYAPNQTNVQSFTTINDLNPANEFYSITVFDGHGRVRATALDHPTSVGQYKAQYMLYDVMGRLAQQSNPTEINSSWQPAGDDVAGWSWSYQSYDWQSRPTVSTNQDGTTKEIGYGGCGCAGGSVMTITDEGTVIMVSGQPQTKRRQQKVFHDVLGRVIKTQILNWEGGTPYSTTVNTYNVRDQITNVKEYSGDATGAEACPSGVCQKTEMAYDGHGRLWKQRRPIEAADNVYLYNTDDTLWRKTDPRGINSVFSYNNRGLVTGISYDTLPNAVLSPVLPSRPIPSSSVAFGYDEAGNRVWMDDSPGRVDYVYDQISRLKEEIRLFDMGGVTRSFTLKYEYNLAGQLKQLTDPWNSTVTYNRDKAGRETSVTGVGYKDQNHDVNVFAGNIQYRAWDGIKQFANGSRGGYTSFAMGYDDRMRLTSYTGNGRTTEHDYYNDGLIKEVRDLHYGPDFLRKYEYDQAGRLTKSHAGGSAQTPSSPYSLTYGYDTWGNSTLRQGSHWSQALPAFSATYVNNRDTNMTYDAAGNVKVYRDVSGGPWIHYDANSKLFTQFEGGAPGFPRFRENYYDGNGAEASYISFQASSPNSITYLIRSSALGGKVISEFSNLIFLVEGDPHKYHGKSYIYLKGLQVAIQEGANAAGQWTYWVHHNPVVGNLFWEQNFDDGSGQSLSLLLNEMTFDPAGTFVGISEPQPIVIPEALANFSSQLYLDNFEGGKCYADGSQTSCNLIYSALNNGYGMQVPWGTTSLGYGQYTTDDPSVKLIIDWDNGYFGFAPTGAKKSRHKQGWAISGVAEGWLDFPIGSPLPFLQQSGGNEQPIQNGPEMTIAALKDSIYGNKELLKRINDCLKKLLGKNFSKFGTQTRANAPAVNGGYTSEELKEKFKQTAPPVALGVGDLKTHGTIYISNEFFTEPVMWRRFEKGFWPGRSGVENAYVHELGNLASFYASGGTTYGLFGKRGASDEDSGYQLQLCVWPEAKAASKR